MGETVANLIGNGENIPTFGTELTLMIPHREGSNRRFGLKWLYMRRGERASRILETMENMAMLGTESTPGLNDHIHTDYPQTGKSEGNSKIQKSLSSSLLASCYLMAAFRI